MSATGYIRAASLVLVLAGVGCEAPIQPPAPSVATVQITPGVDTLLAFGQTRQLNAVAKDGAGNTIAGKTFTWTSTVSSVASVNASGLVTAVANGQASIQATADGVTGSAGVAVAQDVATVQVSPGTDTVRTIGVARQFVATAKDANGNAVTGVKFVWLSSNSSVAVVDTTGLVTARAPGQSIITAAGRGTPGNATLVVVQVARQLAFSVQPTDASAGVGISPAIQLEIRDSAGALVSNARDAVTLAFGTNVGGGSLLGTRTVNAVNGIATFHGLAVDKAAAGYTLTATSGSLTSTTSSAFAISAGAPARLAFLVVPGDVEGTVAFSPAPQVAIQDAFGNLVTSATSPVTTSLNPGTSATLEGNRTIAAVAGVATFGDLRIAQPGTYTLEATSGSLNRAISGSFAVHLTFSSVVAGGDHSCALTTAGATYCWGGNSKGELGDGTSTNRVVPTLVSGGQTFSSLSTGGRYFEAHTCGLTAGGAAYCWGDNAYGQLGDGTTTVRLTPTPASGGLTFTTISAGGENGRVHTCGLTTGGAAYCWGRNDVGQLGDGTMSNRSVPTAVSGGLTFASIAAGAGHTCALTTGGVAYCWGLNAAGEVGDGSTSQRSAPTPVGGGLTFVSISAGSFHSCALTSGGVAYCW